MKKQEKPLWNQKLRWINEDLLVYVISFDVYLQRRKKRLEILVLQGLLGQELFYTVLNKNKKQLTKLYFYTVIFPFEF